MRGGFWRRPVSRTYGYNLELGEHYYSPMTSYLEAERGSRGETPGALTYSERLARKWIYGRRYESEDLRERYTRAASVARGEGAAAAASKSISFLESEMASRSARASSEIRASSSSSAFVSAFARRPAASSSQSNSQQTSTSQSMSSQRQQLLASSQQQSSSQQSSSYSAKSSQQQQSSSQQSSSYSAKTSQQQQQSQSLSSSRFESKQRVEDEICKKVVDIRMWSEGQELGEAQAVTARARCRIQELERELEEITRKAMTSQTRALQTARQMAAAASLEDEASMAAFTKKTREVIMESSRKIFSA